MSKQEQESGIPPVDTTEPALERLTRADVERALEDGTSLQNKDLSGLDLSNLTFSNRDISGSDLSRSSNENTTYERVEAAGTVFAEAIFRESTIREMNGPGSNWAGAQLENTDVLNNNFAQSIWTGAAIRDALEVDQGRSSTSHQSRARSAASEKQAKSDRQISGDRESQTPPPPAAQQQESPITFREVVEHAKTWLQQKKQAANDVVNNTAGVLLGLPTAVQERQENTERVEALHRAMYAAGWDGVQGGTSWVVAQKEVERHWDALVKSGEFSFADIHAGAPLFNRIQEELSAPVHQAPSAVDLTGPRGPEISGNNFQFADMRGVVFQGVSVRGNDFEHADTRGVVFEERDRLMNRFSAQDGKANREAEAKAHHNALDTLGVFNKENELTTKERQEIARALVRKHDQLIQVGIDGRAAWGEAAKEIQEERHPVQHTLKVVVKEAVRGSLDAGQNFPQKAAELIDHGAAPYKFDNKNDHSYYVKLRSEDGAETFRWGKELPEALTRAGAGIGDLVSVERTGQVPVVLNAPLYDPQGKVVGIQAVEAHRNEWQISVVERDQNKASETLIDPEAAKQFDRVVSAQAQARARELGLESTR